MLIPRAYGGNVRPHGDSALAAAVIAGGSDSAVSPQTDSEIIPGADRSHVRPVGNIALAKLICAGRGDSPVLFQTCYVIISGAYGGYIRPFDSSRKRVAFGSGSGDHSVYPYAEGLRVTGAYHICAVSRGSIPRGGKLVKAECLLFFKLFLRLGSLRFGHRNAQRQNGKQRCGQGKRSFFRYRRLRRFLWLFFFL